MSLTFCIAKTTQRVVRKRSELRPNGSNLGEVPQQYEETGCDVDSQFFTNRQWAELVVEKRKQLASSARITEQHSVTVR